MLLIRITIILLFIIAFSHLLNEILLLNRTNVGWTNDGNKNPIDIYKYVLVQQQVVKCTSI